MTTDLDALRLRRGRLDGAEEQQERAGPRVKLTVEVDQETFESAIEEAFRKIAKEVRVPGFRKGKAPRPVLESHIGSEYARAQALEDAIPDTTPTQCAPKQ